MLEFSERPAGRFVDDQVYGAVPPVALNKVETPDPRAISPKVPELLTDKVALRIVRDNEPELTLLPVCKSLTVRMTLVKVPALVGTPLICPPVEIVRPGGRLAAVQEYEPDPPLPVTPKGP